LALFILNKLVCVEKDFTSDVLDEKEGFGFNDDYNNYDSLNENSSSDDEYRLLEYIQNSQNGKGKKLKGWKLIQHFLINYGSEYLNKLIKINDSKSYKFKKSNNILGDDENYKVMNCCEHFPFFSFSSFDKNSNLPIESSIIPSVSNLSCLFLLSIPGSLHWIIFLAFNPSFTSIISNENKIYNSPWSYSSENNNIGLEMLIRKYSLSVLLNSIINMIYYNDG
jgi:hypothetical protein